MIAFLKNECKMGFKALILWSLAIGGFGFACILLYMSMENSISDIATSFEDMGAFTEMFGLKELSMATARGYFATEVGTIHALGSAMFAAVLSTVILSKEEDGHTADYTFTLPLARGKIVVAKFASVIIKIFAFSVICCLFYLAGFAVLSEKDYAADTITFVALQFVMNLEVASICFVISACSRKNKLGIGISVALVLYMFDLISKVVPKLEDAKILSPFYYSNATSVFAGKPVEIIAYALGALIIVVLSVGAGVYYCKRDLA